MKYSLQEITIHDLYQLIKEKKIDLQPSYQRNFIWSNKDQQLLIDSILRGWPLPTFFIYKRNDDMYEMVDGQQRAETICRFIKGDITNTLKKHYHEIDAGHFLSYRLNVTQITDLDLISDENISDFYALVNKRGIHLNPAEVDKAQYAGHPFMNLVEELITIPEVTQLNIFSDQTINRMNDRALIEEIVAYLDYGFFDKRDHVNEIYEKGLDIDTIKSLKESFMHIIKRIDTLNLISPIKETRFRQRNDFFTLFSYINEHYSDLDDEILEYQYHLLCWIDNLGLIRPSNEECELLQKYAFACVTQSNSKESRKTRLRILETILLNSADHNNSEYEQFIDELCDIFNIEEIPHIKIKGYYLINFQEVVINLEDQ